MAMNDRSYAYQEAPAYEWRNMTVLDGGAAREKANKRRGDVVKLVVGVMAVLVYFLGVTFMQAQISSVGKEINSIKSNIEETRTLSAQADLIIGEKTSLTRIESYALSELGMVYPQADSIYFLDQQSSLLIAEGRAGAAPVETAEEVAEDNTLWQDVSTVFEDFFSGQALAAGE